MAWPARARVRAPSSRAGRDPTLPRFAPLETCLRRAALLRVPHRHRVGRGGPAATAASEADLAQVEHCFRQLDEVIAQRTVATGRLDSTWPQIAPRATSSSDRHRLHAGAGAGEQTDARTCRSTRATRQALQAEHRELPVGAAWRDAQAVGAAMQPPGERAPTHVRRLSPTSVRGGQHQRCSASTVVHLSIQFAHVRRARPRLVGTSKVANRPSRRRSCLMEADAHVDELADTAPASGAGRACDTRPAAKWRWMATHTGSIVVGQGVHAPVQRPSSARDQGHRWLQHGAVPGAGQRHLILMLPSWGSSRYSSRMSSSGRLAVELQSCSIERNGGPTAASAQGRQQVAVAQALRRLAQHRWCTQRARYLGQCQTLILRLLQPTITGTRSATARSRGGHVRRWRFMSPLVCRPRPAPAIGPAGGQRDPVARRCPDVRRRPERRVHVGHDAPQTARSVEGTVLTSRAG